MLKGIDISHYQTGLNISANKPGFCIVKATEGTNYVDKTCDGFVQTCIKNNIPWGFYHFARPNNANTEAEWFYKNTLNYFTHGIPVLDFEVSSLTTAWGETFIEQVHKWTGVWPWIYMNSDFLNNKGYFRNSWVKQKCGLWLAGYPSRSVVYPSDVSCPYKHAGWTLAAWQFTDRLKFGGMNIDGDIAYVDAAGWSKYAMGENKATQAVGSVASGGGASDDTATITVEDANYKVTVEKK